MQSPLKVIKVIKNDCKSLMLLIKKKWSLGILSISMMNMTLLSAREMVRNFTELLVLLLSVKWHHISEPHYEYYKLDQFVECTQIKSIRRGVKESIYIRSGSDLNKDEGRHQLPISYVRLKPIRVRSLTPSNSQEHQMALKVDGCRPQATTANSMSWEFV